MSRLLAAGGVVCAGVLAALPFRQPFSRSTPPPLAPAPIALTLRREEVVLLASPQAEVSPATNLEAMASSTSPVPFNHDEKPLVARRTFELTNLAPPPPLPIAFQPAATSEPPSPGTWRPVSREPPALPHPAKAVRPADKPRTYRLRDGDTLENVAERYLGSAARAAQLFEANRDVLARPDLLPVGKSIVLPPKREPGELEPIHERP
jgi:nucleoid-associated protein YgaU